MGKLTEPEERLKGDEYERIIDMLPVLAATESSQHLPSHEELCRLFLGYVGSEVCDLANDAHDNNDADLAQTAIDIA